MGLHLYEFVKDYIYPSISSKKSHPNALDRLWKLRGKINKKHGYSVEEIQESLKWIEDFKHFLADKILPFHARIFEFYGSLYLPSFRNKIRTDRIDY